VVTNTSTRGLRRLDREMSPGRAMADTGPDHSDLGWFAGSWGKGWLFGNGRVVTWATPQMGGEPEHEAKLYEMDAAGKLPDGFDPGDWAQAVPVVIDPEGGVALGYMGGDVGGTPSPDQMRQLRAADGSLRRPAASSPISWPDYERSPGRHKGEGPATRKGDYRPMTIEQASAEFPPLPPELAAAVDAYGVRGRYSLFGADPGNQPSARINSLLRHRVPPEAFAKLGPTTLTGDALRQAVFSMAGGERPPDWLTSYDPAEVLRGMDLATRGQGAPRDLVTWRGVDDATYRRLRGLRPGDAGVMDLGFQSTSLVREDAEGEYAVNGGLLEIRVPEGTPAVWKGEPDSLDEAELVLGRGLRMRVVSQEPDRTVLEVVPDVEASPGRVEFRDWNPGVWGKGLILPDGSLDKWATDKNGYPEHQDRADAQAAGRLADSGVPVVITPDGFATVTDSTYFNEAMLREEFSKGPATATGRGFYTAGEWFGDELPSYEDPDRPAWEVELERRREAASSAVRGAGLKWEPSYQRWWEKRALPELDKWETGRERSPGRAGVPERSVNNWYPGAPGKAWVWPDEGRVIAWQTDNYGDPEHARVGLDGLRLPGSSRASATDEPDAVDRMMALMDSGAVAVTIDPDGQAHDAYVAEERDAPAPDVMRALRAVMGSEVSARQGRDPGLRGIGEESPGRAGPRQRFMDAERARLRARPESAEDRLFVRNNAEALPDDQRAALTAYTSDGGNQALDEAGRASLDALVRSHPLPEPVTVSRRIRAGELDGLAPGDVLGEDRFASTTIGTAWTIGAADDNGGLQVELPAGTPAYYVPDSFGVESEVILPPNLPLRVAEVGTRRGLPWARAEADPSATPNRELSPQYVAAEREQRRTHVTSRAAVLERAERDLWRARHGRGDPAEAQAAVDAARARNPEMSPGRAAGVPEQVDRAFLASVEGEHRLRDGRVLRTRIEEDGVYRDNGRLTVEGYIEDPSVSPELAGPHAMPGGVGVFRRSLRPDPRFGYVVSKEMLWLDPAYRRQGFAADLDRTSEEAWGRIGVRRVELTTDDDGGYVWARLGYRLDPERYMAEGGESADLLLYNTPGFEDLAPTHANIARAYLYQVLDNAVHDTERDAEQEGDREQRPSPAPERLAEVLAMVQRGELGDVGDVAALPDGRALLSDAIWEGYKDIGPSHPPNAAAAEPDGERSPGRVAAPPKLRPEFAAMVRAKREEAAEPYMSRSDPRRWAENSDMTPEEYEAAVAEHVGGLARKADLVVRIDQQYLGRFLRGHIANQHESGHSGGAFSPVMRARAEAGAWEIEGVQPDRGEGYNHSPAAKFAAEHPDRFPVYGYFSQGEDLPTPPGETMYSARSNNASQYGGVKLVLKPGVKERTYLFLGDSLGNLERAVGMPSPALRPSPLSSEDDPLDYTELGPDAVEGTTPWPYTEAEIFGGVRPEDVDHAELASAPEGDLLAAFAQSRVPWTVGQANSRNRPQISGDQRADRARAWTDKGHTLAELRDPETPKKNWLGESQRMSGVRRRGFERTPLGLLVSTGQPDMERYASPALGRLLVPGSYGQSAEDAAEGVPFAADNGGFWGVPEGDYKRMAEELSGGRKKPLWVTVPDVFLHPFLTHSGRRIWAPNRKDAEREAGGRVREDKKTPPHGDADATIARFEQWSQYLRHEGLPAAFVAQDGMDSPERLAWLDKHWDDISAVFIGGSDDFKLGPGGARVAELAHDHGKLVHVGRVNTHMRIAYARDVLHADSIDGGTFSKFKDTYLPSGLAYIPTGGPPPTKIGQEWVRSAAEAARGEHAWPRPPGRDKPQWPRGFFPTPAEASPGRAMPDEWMPGSWGKGHVSPGGVVTWSTDEAGFPEHSGVTPDDGTDFIITPDGAVWSDEFAQYGQGDGRLPGELMRRVRAHDSALRAPRRSEVLEAAGPGLSATRTSPTRSTPPA
jgi:GNAT superfamily N-acetyltransferase